MQIAQDAAPCAFSVSPLARTVAGAGGETTVAVTTNSACGWTASSNASWLTIRSGASSSGNGVVTIAVAPSALDSRTGTVAIAGQAVVITQMASKCIYGVAPDTFDVVSAGATLSTSVTAISTDPGCSWAASSSVPWIAVDTASHSTVGTFAFTVAANSGPIRTGTLSIAADTITVTQAAPPPASTCNNSINPATQSVAASGLAGVTVAVTAGAGCAWTAVSNDSWLSITTGAAGSGSGQVVFNVAANGSTTPRVGTLTISGQTVTVSQAGVTSPCTYALSETGQTVAASGGAGTAVSVSTTASCSWTAASNASWITVTSGAIGSGSGSVTFTVATNSGAQRSGTMTIAGQTYTVTQSAASSPCSYSINPTSASVSENGIPGSTVNVSTTPSCSWTAAPNDMWITVKTGGSGSGNGKVTFAVVANTGPARTGSMTIADQTFTVSQADGCSYQLSPTSQSFINVGGSGGPISITAPTSCTWTAQSSASWITLTGQASGSGNGTVTFTVSPTTADRNGKITIASQTFTITQKK